MTVHGVRLGSALLVAAAVAVPVGAAALPAHADSPRVEVTVALTPADPAGLGRLAAEPAVHHDARQLGGVAPSAHNRDRVTAWLRGHGLTVTHADAWSVTATTDRRTAGAAFPGGRVPDALRGDATAVVGLSDAPVWHHHAAAPRPYTPAEVRAAYAVPGAAAGRGVTVASVQFSGWFQLAAPDRGDLAAYARTFGLPAPDVTAVAVNDARLTLPTREGDDFEVAMDQEALLAAAPAASQRVYVSTNDVQGGLLVWQRIADDVAAGAPIRVVTTSWGDCEPDLGRAQIQAIEYQIERLAAMGVTVFAASGDSGGYDCPAGTPWANQPAVDFPASSPHVVAVGGTRLASTDGRWQDTAWGPAHLTAGPAHGSGGGVSSVFPRPAWQRGVTGLPPYRLVPDIAGVADPAAGFAVYWTQDGAAGGWWVGAGTSVAAPLQAGFYAALLGGPTAGGVVSDLHTALYAHPEVVRDVVAGGNGAYPAGPGYDLATGLGAPLWAAVDPAVHGPALVLPAGTRDGQLLFGTDVPAGVENGSYYLAEGVRDCAGNQLIGTPLHEGVMEIDASGPDRVASVGFAVPTWTGTCETDTRTTVVDRAAPAAAAALAATADGGLKLAWSARDAAPSSGVGYTLRLTAQRPGQAAATVLTSYAGAAGATVVDAPAGATYRLQVTAVDGAGNRSAAAWSAPVALR